MGTLTFRQSDGYPLWLDMTCLHYRSSLSKHQGMTTWLNYIIDTSWNKHWVTIHKIHRWIHSEVTNTSTYCPQGNGLSESSNKNLMTIIKKTVGDNKKAWDSKIKFALWANRITKKSSTKRSPFELVYGLDVTLHVHLRWHLGHRQVQKDSF